MVLNKKIPTSLLPFFKSELAAADKAMANGELTQSWRHLERAHILGQPYAYQHIFVHWEMLKFGIRIKSPKEILGQLPRLLVGGVKSFVGHVPVGNTGGANVPALRPMEIPTDLKVIIETYSH